MKQRMTKKQQQMSQMIAHSVPMMELSKVYPPQVCGIALKVAYELSQPVEVKAAMDEVVELAESLAWLDQDIRHCKLTERVIRLILSNGVEAFVIACNTRPVLARLTLKRSLGL